MEATQRTRGQRLGLLGLLLLAGMLLFYSCGANISDYLDGDDDPEVQSSPFQLGGDVTEAMMPGVMMPIDVSVTNSSDDALVVTDLAVTVSGVSAPRATHRLPCTTADFAVRQAMVVADVTIAAHATATLSQLDIPAESWPRVGMLDRNRNQDGCQRSSLTLDYTASGTLPR